MSTVPEPPITPEVMQYLDEQYDAIEAIHAPDICNTLGLMAVKGDLLRGVILTHAEPWLESELPDANEGVARELQQTRKRIEAIEPDRRLEACSKVLHGEMPDFILRAIGVDYDFQIFDRLVEQNTDGIYVVSDDVLLNFLQFHNYRMTKWRERFMEREWPIRKTDYTYKLKAAVKDDWLPESVLQPDRLDALEQVEVTVDDGMLLYEQGSEAFMNSYDNASATEVYFPQYTFMEIAYHELSHVMVGVTLPKKESEGRFSGGIMAHGLYRLFDEKHKNGGKVMDEAVTEHIAQTMNEIKPNPEVIDPDAKRSLRASYYAERELLDVLCNGGKKPVDIRLFISAYFEDSKGQRQPALRKLKRSLKKAFPRRDVLGELGELMSHGEYRDARQGLHAFTHDLKAAYA